MALQEHGDADFGGFEAVRAVIVDVDDGHAPQDRESRIQGFSFGAFA